MRSPVLRATRTDRVGDPRGSPLQRAKPAVLRRRTQRWLCAAWLTLIVVGTLGPLGNGDRPWLSAPAQWTWLPAERPTDANDIYTNFLVYVPVGAAFRLLVRRRGCAGASDFIVGLALSVALSYGTELLQQFMPYRSSSLTDVYVNGVAALFGCLLAVPLQSAIRYLHARVFMQLHVQRRTWAIACLAAVVITVGVMTMPPSVKRPHWEGFFGLSLVGSDPRATERFLVFATIGFLRTAHALAAGKRRRRAWLGSLWRVALLVLGLEMVQTMLAQYFGSLLQATIAICGGAAGALLATALIPVGQTAPRRDQRPRTEASLTPPALPRGLHRLAAILMAFGLVSLAGMRIAPGVWHGQFRAVPVFEWMPFKAHFAVPFSMALADFAQQGATYATLVFLGLLMTRGQQRTVPLLLLVSTLGLIATCQAFCAGQRPDSTPFIVATATWLITTRIWTSLYPATNVQELRISTT